MTETPVQMLDACTIVNRRPRNLPQYQAACKAAVGQVFEVDAAEVEPRDVIWFHGLWRQVSAVGIGSQTIQIHMAAVDGTAMWCTDRSTPVCRHAAG